MTQSLYFNNSNLSLEWSKLTSQMKQFRSKNCKDTTKTVCGFVNVRRNIMTRHFLSYFNWLLIIRWSVEIIHINYTQRHLWFLIFKRKRFRKFYKMDFIWTGFRKKNKVFWSFSAIFKVFLECVLCSVLKTHYIRKRL